MRRCCPRPPILSRRPPLADRTVRAPPLRTLPLSPNSGNLMQFGNEPQFSPLLRTTYSLRLQPRRSLSFLPSSASQPQTSAGFTMAYPLIVLHAVSSTLSGFSQPRKCIYCQIETMADRVEEDYENEDADTLKEMWIVPAYEEQGELSCHDKA